MIKQDRQAKIKGHFDDRPGLSREDQQKIDRHRDVVVSVIELLIVLAILSLVLANLFNW